MQLSSNPCSVHNLLNYLLNARLFRKVKLHCIQFRYRYKVIKTPYKTRYCLKCFFFGFSNIKLMNIFYAKQSQPCHWRNAKSVAKRSTDVEVATTPAALSQNINLFQSLRVLQEGENGEDASALSNRKYTFYTSYIIFRARIYIE